MKNRLYFKKIVESKNLVSESTYNGSINPIGLPNDWKVFIDPKVMEVDRIICGSGRKESKLSLPSKYLLKLNNAEILENLAKE